MSDRGIFPSGRTARPIGLATVLLAVTVWGIATTQQAAVADDEAAIAQANSLSRAFRSAAKAVIPTVVTVRTTTQTSNVGRGNPLYDFFDDSPSSPFSHPNVPMPGMGSGVIIGEGLVLTNNHVVANTDKVMIELTDGRILPVTDVKTDPQTDLAVLRFESDRPLPIARLGDSDKLEIGDWVIAIGNPFDLQQTVSAGIISAKGRSLDKVKRARCLQTDAAINPGNSGGPLVNLSGEVIGINTAIVSRSGGYQGIGFAIPINLAKWVTPQLAENGSVRRAYLGVVIGEIDVDRRDELGVGPNQGVLVEAVGEDTPAAKAGLRKDDVVLSFDGQPTRNVPDLQEIVERSRADSKHEIEVLRDGQSLKLQVAVVEKLPENFGQTSRAFIGKPNLYVDEQLGLTVMELSDFMAQRLGFEDGKGALIFSVDTSRPAGRAGLRDGMLIRKVDGKAINSVAEFADAMKDADVSQGVTLEIQTKSGSRAVTITSK